MALLVCADEQKTDSGCAKMLECTVPLAAENFDLLLSTAPPAAGSGWLIMTRTIHSARITGPVTGVAASGKPLKLPMGPCLAEQGDEREVKIIWGSQGQNCAALPVAELANAEESGWLVLLD